MFLTKTLRDGHKFAKTERCNSPHQGISPEHGTEEPIENKRLDLVEETLWAEKNCFLSKPSKDFSLLLFFCSHSHTGSIYVQIILLPHLCLLVFLCITLFSETCNLLGDVFIF